MDPGPLLEIVGDQLREPLDGLSATSGFDARRSESADGSPEKIRLRTRESPSTKPRRVSSIFAMTSLVWMAQSCARSRSALAFIRTAMKTACTSRGIAMRVRPFLKMVNWVRMTSMNEYGFRDHDRGPVSSALGAATAGRIGQLTIWRLRPPPTGPGATAARLAIRGPVRRHARAVALATVGVGLHENRQQAGELLAGVQERRRHQVGPGLLECHDHRVHAGILGRPGDRVGAVSWGVVATRPPASRIGSEASDISFRPQRPTRILNSGNRARSRLHRYRVWASPPGGVVAMQISAGALGHLVEQLGGQRPGGDDLEAPSGRIEHLLQHLQGQAILHIVGRTAEDGIAG